MNIAGRKLIKKGAKPKLCKGSSGGSGGGGGGAATAESTGLFGSTTHNVDFDPQKIAAAYNISLEEAREMREYINDFTGAAYTSIRKSQKEGKDNVKAKLIEKYLKGAARYEGVTNRGVGLNSIDDFVARYGTVGSVFTEKAMNSWSSSHRVAKGFAVNNNRPLPVVFTVRNRSGSSIRNVSNFFGESEVLTGKNTSYRIVSIKPGKVTSEGVSKQGLYVRVEEVN